MWCGTSITFGGRTPRSQTSVRSSRDLCLSGPQSPHLTNGDRPAFGKTRMCQASEHKENPKGPELISQDGQAGRHRPGRVECSESQGPPCTGSAGRAQTPKQEPDCFSLLPAEAPRPQCGCDIHSAEGARTHISCTISQCFTVSEKFPFFKSPYGARSLWVSPRVQTPTWAFIFFEFSTLRSFQTFRKVAR